MLAPPLARPTPMKPTCRPVLRRAALLACTALGLTGCSQPDAIPFEPRELHALELAAADDVEFRRLPELGQSPRNEQDYLDVLAVLDEERERGATGDPGFGPTSQPATRPAKTVYLPLSEAVRRATVNNLDIKVAAFEPAIEATRTIEALARFDPTFRQRLEGRYADQQIAGQLIDQTSIVTDLQRVFSSSSSLTQQLGAGGQAELTYGITYLNSPTNFDRGLTTLEETFESSLTFRLTQPILRDFGSDTNRARIVISQNNRRVSILDFRQRLEEVLVDVEQTYWQLSQAQREVEIQTDLLTRTIATAETIAARIVVDANAGQVAQAEQFISERRAILIQAEAQAAILGERLKQLMNDPDLPIAGTHEIVPTTPPIDAPVLFDYEEALATALLLRPEIATQLIRVESAETALDVGRNNILPRLDFVVEAGFQGLDEDYVDSVENQFEFDNLTFGAGLQFEIPIGNRAARAVLRRALSQRSQAIVQYAALKNQITSELKQSQMQLSAAYAVLAERRRASDAAAEVVRVEQTRGEDGNLTPEFVDRLLRYLSDLARVRAAEVQALTQYNVALAQFERAKGTLLRYNNIVLSESLGNNFVGVGKPVR